MVSKQRMRLAADTYSKTVTQRGNVPKTLVCYFLCVSVTPRVFLCLVT